MHISTYDLCAIIGIPASDFVTLRRVTKPDLPRTKAVTPGRGRGPDLWVIGPVIAWLSSMLPGGVTAAQKRAIVERSLA